MTRPYLPDARVFAQGVTMLRLEVVAWQLLRRWRFALRKKDGGLALLFNGYTRSTGGIDLPQNYGSWCLMSAFCCLVVLPSHAPAERLTDCGTRYFCSAVSRFDKAAHTDYIEFLTTLICPTDGNTTAQAETLGSVPAAIKAAEALPLLHTAVDEARRRKWLTVTKAVEVAHGHDKGREKRRRVDDSEILEYCKLYSKLLVIVTGQPALTPLIQILESE